MSCLCQECRKQYKIDLIIPDEMWKLISPNKDDSGLLCGECIMKKLEQLNKYGVLNTKGSLL